MNTGAEDFLPGFERIEDLLATVPVNISDEEIDRNADKRFPGITLERIKAERPDLCQMVARAFFNLGLTLRQISHITGLHRNTCSEIIAERNATDEIKAVKKERLLRVHQLGNIALTRLSDLLMDQAAVKKAGLTGMLDVVRKLHDLEIDLNPETNDKVVDAGTVARVHGFKSEAEEFLN